jgi:hypothetical protein
MSATELLVSPRLLGSVKSGQSVPVSLVDSAAVSTKIKRTQLFLKCLTPSRDQAVGLFLPELPLELISV